MAAVPLLACAKRASSAIGSAGAAVGANTQIPPIGIQLYTLRSVMDKDLDGVLAEVARIGYKEVELASLHGRTPAEMRALLDRNGLVAPSAHVGLDQIRARPDVVLGDAKILGCRWVVCPWVNDDERTPDGFARVAQDLGRFAQRARSVGIGVAYHNHDFEFKPFADGRLPYDVLLASTDPSLVKMEMDLFWITKGGKDPLAYFARWPGRFPMVHVKDMSAAGTFADVGTGTIDFGRIAAHAKEAGIEHWFVEHDEPASPLASAAASFAGVKKFLAAR